MIRGKAKSAKVLCISETTIYFDRPHKLSGFSLGMSSEALYAGLENRTIKII